MLAYTDTPLRRRYRRRQYGLLLRGCEFRVACFITCPTISWINSASSADVAGTKKRKKRLIRHKTLPIANFMRYKWYRPIATITPTRSHHFFFWGLALLLMHRGIVEGVGDTLLGIITKLNRSVSCRLALPHRYSFFPLTRVRWPVRWYDGLKLMTEHYLGHFHRHIAEFQ